MNSLNNWRAFISPRVDEASAQNLTAPLPESLSLAGETITGRDFPTPECQIDLDDLAFPEEAFAVESVAMVATVVHCKEARHVRLGFGTDWWISVFVNGVQIGTTFPAGNVVASFSCWDHIYEADFQAGDNVISCLVKRGAGGWLFAAAELPEMPMRLSPGLFQRIYLDSPERLTCPPYLQPWEKGLALCVKLNNPGTAVLDWREKGSNEWKRMEPALESWQVPVGIFHRFILTDLHAGASYECRVTTMDDFMRNPVEEPLMTFRLPGSTDGHSIYLTADLQLPEYKRRPIIRRLFQSSEAQRADLFCTLGDMDNSSQDICHSYFDIVLDEMLQPRPQAPIWLPIRGNHEMTRGESSQWEHYFGPTFFLFRYGDTAYLVLDTAEERIPPDDSTFYSRRTRLNALFPAQREWIQKAISSPEFTTARHHIVLSHGTPFIQDAISREQPYPFMARNLETLVGDFFYGPDAPVKPDLWLCGHTHRYVRFDPPSQTMAAFPGYSHYLADEEKDRYQFPIIVLDGTGGIGPKEGCGVLLDISEKSIDCTVREPDGTLIDHLAISKDGSIDVLDTVLP